MKKKEYALYKGDNYLYGGTVCCSAKDNNRRFIGFEINEEFYKKSIDRLNGINSIGQTSIFTDFDNL